MGSTEQYNGRIESVVEAPARCPDLSIDDADAENLSNSLLDEDCLSLAEAARRLPRVRGKKPPHPSTLFRWASQGRKSKSGKIVHLEVIKVGGTNCTSVEALNRFIDRINDIEPVAPPKSRKQTVLDKQAKAARKVLRQRGLIK